MDMTMEEFDKAVSGSMVGDEVRPGQKVTGIVIATFRDFRICRYQRQERRNHRSGGICRRGRSIDR